LGGLGAAGNTGAAGGSGSGSMGNVTNSGGNGGNSAFCDLNNAGGGGGGSATPTSNGGNGGNAFCGFNGLIGVGGTGGSGDGLGGNGESGNAGAGNGTAPGGGGGGKGDGTTSGSGAIGRVIITVNSCVDQCDVPIELLSFTGRAVENKVALNWQTVTELNNDYMAVEHSADGRTFREIGRLNGVGTTYEPQTYTFIDERPLPGVNYYRLRQVDYDGAFEIHPTIAVTYRGDEGELQVGIFPNPATDVLHVRWTGLEDGDTELRVFDLNGREMLRYRTDGNSAGYDLPLSQLPVGMYVLQLTTNERTKVIRFKKQ